MTVTRPVRRFCNEYKPSPSPLGTAAHESQLAGCARGEPFSPPRAGARAPAAWCTRAVPGFEGYARRRPAAPRGARAALQRVADHIAGAIRRRARGDTSVLLRGQPKVRGPLARMAVERAQRRAQQPRARREHHVGMGPRALHIPDDCLQGGGESKRLAPQP